MATSRARWARTVAAPEIQRLSNHGDYVEAFLLARQALDLLPDDRHLYQLWLDTSIPAVVTSDPPGADVAVASYHARTSSWFPLGRTPLNGVRIPRSLFRVRISKAGFQTIEGSGSPPALRYALDPENAVPSGMAATRAARPVPSAAWNPACRSDAIASRQCRTTSGAASVEAWSTKSMKCAQCASRAPGVSSVGIRISVNARSASKSARSKNTGW